GPELLGIAFGGVIDDPMVDPAPLEDGVALGRGAVDVQSLALALEFSQQGVQLFAVDVDSILEVLVGAVGVQRHVEFALPQLRDVALKLRPAETKIALRSREAADTSPIDRIQLGVDDLEARLVENEFDRGETVVLEMLVADG